MSLPALGERVSIVATVHKDQPLAVTSSATLSECSKIVKDSDLAFAKITEGKAGFASKNIVTRVADRYQRFGQNLADGPLPLVPWAGYFGGAGWAGAELAGGMGIAMGLGAVGVLAVAAGVIGSKAVKALPKLRERQAKRLITVEAVTPMVTRFREATGYEKLVLGVTLQGWKAALEAGRSLKPEAKELLASVDDEMRAMPADTVRQVGALRQLAVKLALPVWGPIDVRDVEGNLNILPEADRLALAAEIYATRQTKNDDGYEAQHAMYALTKPKAA